MEHAFIRVAGVITKQDSSVLEKLRDCVKDTNTYFEANEEFVAQINTLSEVESKGLKCRGTY